MLVYSTVYFLFQEYKSAVCNSARAFMNFSFVQFLSLLSDLIFIFSLLRPPARREGLRLASFWGF